MAYFLGHPRCDKLNLFILQINGHGSIYEIVTVSGLYCSLVSIRHPSAINTERNIFIPLSHLCGSNRGFLRFYRKPQIYRRKDVKEPHWPQSKRKPSAKQPQLSAD